MGRVVGGVWEAWVRGDVLFVRDLGCVCAGAGSREAEGFGNLVLVSRCVLRHDCVSRMRVS